MAKSKKPDPDTTADPKVDPTPPVDTTPPKGAVKTGQPVGTAVPDAPADLPDAPASDSRETAKRGGFMPALVGGILAASLGFLAARSEILDPILPAALKSGTSEAVAALREADTAQAVTLAATLAAMRTEITTEITAEITAIDLPDLGPISAQLTELQAGIARQKSTAETQQAHLRDMEARLNPLSTRLEDLEKRPMTDGASEAAMAAYDRELAALRDAIVAQRVDVEAMIDEARATEAAARALKESAAAAARTAQTHATVARLHAALQTGAGYGVILAELASAGVVVPDALSASANAGVATLSALADAFPSVARVALAAARTDAGDSGGLGGFLQRQLGARSLQPRDGDDPDAILSRAEAAVIAGDLSAALEEISNLPDAARAQMQGWADRANNRLTALAAADQLAQSLNPN